MSTIWDERSRDALLARVASLRPESQPRWGSMTCRQMLAHLSDAVRMPLGQIVIAPRRTPLRFAPLRFAVIHLLPFPKGAPTAPELLARQAESVEAEAAELRGLFGELASRADQRAWPDHPLFGRMSRRDWGALVHKHIDHHLRQFGV